MALCFTNASAHRWASDDLPEQRSLDLPGPPGGGRADRVRGGFGGGVRVGEPHEGPRPRKHAGGPPHPLFCGIFVGEVNRVHAELVGVPTGSRSCGWYTVTASLHVGLNSVTTSSDAVQVLCPASLGISKVAQTPFASMGDIVSFKVSVSNFGQEPSGVFQVNDPLPVGLTWFVQGAFNMECQVTARILYCEGDRLPPGTTAYTIVYAVATNCGSYVNPEATLIQGHRAVAATAAIISIACPPIPTATATATSTPTQTRPPQVSVTPTRIVPGPPNTGGGLGTNDHSWWMIPSILLLGGLVAYILGRRGG